MRIFETIALLFSRAAGRRPRSEGLAGSRVGARAACRACPLRRAHAGRPHAAHMHAPQASRARRPPFEPRRPERFGAGDVEPGSSNAPEAGGIKL
ncbi:hypothetical protein WS72_30625 [Burkholderia savannae]|uniref:Uncharacterized protein n=1 Tax=Burkholderia savannae TaxID=1637837 RepID=A0ABR5TCE5_9BURK|nr:hypothetical protein [Burkholderia savannae]KWZ39452.1 hypothetical protein WS72_30625 [Burkholderia savannae]